MGLGVGVESRFEQEEWHSRVRSSELYDVEMSRHTRAIRDWPERTRTLTLTLALSLPLALALALTLFEPEHGTPPSPSLSRHSDSIGIRIMVIRANLNCT